MHYKPAGYRKTKQGKKKLYKCMVCNKKFTPDSAYLGMRHDPEIIHQCIDMYLRGMSFRAIRDHMIDVRGIKITHMAIYRWVQKYSKIVKPYTDSFKLNGQDCYMNADETMIQIAGEWGWIWNLMIKENRFIISSRISKTREMSDAKALFKEGRNKLEGLPMKVTTDGMKAYPRAIRSAFHRNSYPRVEHYVAPSITNRHQNNLIERHHNTIKARTKTMRGFGNISSASNMMDMWHIYYNFIRPNMSLGGKTPSESAGLGKHNFKELIDDAYEWNKRCFNGN